MLYFEVLFLYMKQLVNFLLECDFITPINTMGMGDVSISGNILSEPIGINIKKKKKSQKMIKPLKKYIIQKINEQNMFGKFVDA